MDKKTGNPNKKPINLEGLKRDALLYKVMPQFVMEIMHKYFRTKVEGIENIPKSGPAIITPNHSGYSGFDAMMLMHEIKQGTGRLPRILAHHFWFLNKATAIPASKMGFVEATKDKGLKLLKKKNLIILFPEGEYGNFKPTNKAYELQDFKRGFVRMALKTKSPIIPTVVIGAEETHINLTQLKLTKYLRGLVIPLPLNILPLPAKWKIKFLEPMYLPYKPEAADNAELVHEIAQDVRERIQRAINKEVKNRKHIYLDD